ncbi:MULTISPECIES: GNAT family N-acetyltransferase [unclassified Microcoleus]|uniref:GNAT family N-acetyltransferase n=1 Tax=unclassified Microcoleus TaxID=2642155 RepID=UPI002FCF8D8A
MYDSVPTHYAMEYLTFREADGEDIQAIVNIHNSHARSQNTSIDRGFLLTQITEDEIVQSLNNSCKYFVSAKTDGEIVGFVAISQPKISDEILDKIIWKDEVFKKRVTSDRHFYLERVATKVDWMGRGVARFMYKEIYQVFPNSFISLFIVTQPIANARSLMFHQKQGFEQIGTLQIDRFLDLENYECIVMFKET